MNHTTSPTTHLIDETTQRDANRAPGESTPGRGASPHPAWLAAALVALCAVGCGTEADAQAEADAADEAAAATATPASVGQKLFFDTRLSEPAGVACATCHDPAHGFADGRPGPSSQGSVAGRFGVRNSPSMAYASFTPSFAVGGNEAGYSGGLFLDGRVPTLEEQAAGPLLNPLEMNNTSKAQVVAKIRTSSYASSFKKVYGSAIFNNTDAAFDKAMAAIAAYERTGITNRFTSKYDAFLAGKAQLTSAEAHGLALFEDPAKGNCASCHISRPTAQNPQPLFTDFGYDNLGIPRNPQNPFYNLPSNLNPQGANYVDRGLGGVIINPRQIGRFKAPTLRNIALTAPYGHNGYFADLRSIVKFYNDRDVASPAWPAAEVGLNINAANMGNLGMSSADIDDMVAFLKTLSDGWKP